MPQHDVMFPAKAVSRRRSERATEPPRGRVTEFPVLSPSDRLSRRWYLAGRRAVEVLVAAVLLALMAPILAVTALLVRLTSTGPAIYTQTRLGQGGRPFTIYKFRTMIHNCESLTGPRWAILGDPRITSIGHFLRATHLDELPQLWNVLLGDMSLIGPRPERPEFVPLLERSIPRYRERLAVRPGITGLAQVQLPPDSDLESVARKLACDLQYIQMVGPWLDIKIIAATVCKLLGVSYRTTKRLLRLPGPESLDAVRTERPLRKAA
ncbi:MAG: sugar transferase [Gemmataceae bacterium]|nr:sugar transferase [Gemmataceae bacterium]MDW8266965.1 sugar transferase [Gemmataceae bacterium]